MIQNLLPIAATAMMGLAVFATICLRSPLRATSLRGAWRWGVAAEFAWLLSCLITASVPVGSPALDQCWLWTAILTLCPLIAALGARRPTNRIWSWFIIVPLLAVLGWPSFTVLFHWPEVAPLKVQAPGCIGFALVAFMGIGNYVGTRFTLSAILAGLASMMAIAPLTTIVEIHAETATLLRASAGLILAGAVFHALRQGHREFLEENPYDKLWFDFRDTFGIVWSIRIQERINEIAEKDGWACRLGPIGFEWNLRTTSESRQTTQQKMDHVIRWHLRRFVDPSWIDARLHSAANSTNASGIEVQESSLPE